MARNISVIVPSIFGKMYLFGLGNKGIKMSNPGNVTSVELAAASEDLQKEKADYDKAIQDVIGKENGNFEDRKKWLEQKWKAAKDSVPLRLISGVILNKTPTPINVSIIADNLNYFKEHSGGYNANDLETALGRACLCGSRKIAEFILEKLKSSYIATEHQYLLGYVSASQNEAWVEDIAKKMVEAKIAIPMSVYNLAHSYKIIDKIVQIFNATQQNTDQDVKNRERFYI